MLAAHYPRMAKSKFEGALRKRYHVGYSFLLPKVKKRPYVQASGTCVAVESRFETELVKKRNHVPRCSGPDSLRELRRLLCKAQVSGCLCRSSGFRAPPFLRPRFFSAPPALVPAKAESLPGPRILARLLRLFPGLPFVISLEFDHQNGSRGSLDEGNGAGEFFFASGKSYQRSVNKFNCRGAAGEDFWDRVHCLGNFAERDDAERARAGFFNKVKLEIG